MSARTLDGQAILITGAAHRIGAQMARMLHAEGASIVIHYRNSKAGAEDLQQELNRQRADSAQLVSGDLLDISNMEHIIDQAVAHYGGLHALINNASSFYPTPVGSITETQWDDLIGTNMKAPLFLSQAAAPHLKTTHGCIINIVDIHAERPLKEHPVYSMAKAGLVMMTRSLACELGPEVRVNAIAPGAILWPENDMDEQTQEKIISRTFLKRRGDPGDIARAALFLVMNADYISGQVMTVDGGRSLNS